MKPIKPLGRKSYGSIPHLPGSRRGSGDHGVNEGQYRICCEKERPGETIVVQEKLDGSNVCVARVDGILFALGRAGYPAQSSRFELIGLRVLSGELSAKERLRFWQSMLGRERLTDFTCPT